MFGIDFVVIRISSTSTFPRLRGPSPRKLPLADREVEALARPKVDVEDMPRTATGRPPRILKA